MSLYLKLAQRHGEKKKRQGQILIPVADSNNGITIWITWLHQSHRRIEGMEEG